MLAVGAVVSDTGIRAGEMCARTIEDLSPTLEELRAVRRPQGRSESEACTELLALSGLSRAALKRWLPERQQLLERVGGTATALWVSLHGNHHVGKAVPAGTPLMPDAEKAAVLLDDVAARGRTLAELRRAGEEGGTAELQGRIAVRQAVRDAWAEGIEHTVQLSTLAHAGLADTVSLAAGGWEPVLLDVIDRGQGRGRPTKAAAAE
ncbi:hypothetical protein ACFQ77_40685 [Streptomyces virginiae]|uniref:hypothetical protein n=1 Tax=Streptomyces virginiae TaxID=1961 RepID=UPI0036A05E58